MIVNRWEVRRVMTSEISGHKQFLLKINMVSTAKKNRRKAQRDAIHVRHQMDLGFSGEEEDT